MGGLGKENKGVKRSRLRVARGRPVYPIIHIIGLPGAGKTTLANRLANTLKLPVCRIGEYRRTFPLTWMGEADAWLTLFRALSERNWGNCILETTGLNRRESFLSAVLPFSQRVTLKLEAQRKVLIARIGKKRKEEQGGDWFFSSDYADKNEFVKELYGQFMKLPADIRIDTSKIQKERVYQIALKRLENYQVYLSDCYRT